MCGTESMETASLDYSSEKFNSKGEERERSVASDMQSGDFLLILRN